MPLSKSAEQISRADNDEKKSEAELADWQAVARLEEVQAETINKVSVQELQLIVLKHEGEVFAYLDQCPHELYPLSEGDVDEGLIICPKHLWEFEIRTGQHITKLPSTNKNLLQYAVRVVDGVVEVDVSSAARRIEE